MRNPPSRRRQFSTALGWGLLVLLGVAAASLTGWSLLGLLGVVPPPSPGGHALAPPDLASMAVAGATLLLATVTVALAVFTRRSLALSRAELTLAEASVTAVQEQAKKLAEQVAATHEQVAATQAQAAVARQTLESSWRPFLVDVPVGYATRPVFSPGGTVMADAAGINFYKRENGTARVAVPFRNIGSGLAVIAKSGLSFGQLHTAATSFSSSIVAVGEVVRVVFEIEPAGAVLINLISQLDAGKPFVVTVFYGDQSGVGKWRSRAQVFRPAGNVNYEVLNVELYEGEDTKPFATSGPL